MQNCSIAAALGGLLGLALLAAAQQPAPAPAGPTSRANLILVQTAARPDSVLAGLRTYLVNNGFVPDTLDPVRGLLTTRVLAEGELLAEQMKIRAVRTGAGWRLTGVYLMGGPGGKNFTAFPALNFGLSDAPAKTAFRELDGAAHAIPGGTLSYGRAKVPFGAFTKWQDALKMPW
ncbi:hypothetical protein ACFP2F_05540 [Hymenobacter artigasi]|uniref:Uncharacterized protein n=1 Tax=Hymenobacter artigasi TaxID=2719616 RepID=A0ABX1HDK4_9BACT|nr:hypothetical protein [Hymenobacter artigasi]NKI88324.1 hypothetical protein [Hymenobacter artigasi]